MLLLKLCVVAAILVLISRLDIITATTLARILSRPAAAVASILAVAAAIQMSALRWYLLLSIQGQSIPLRRLWVITLTSYFVGSSTLGTFGTDALRLYYIGRERPNSVGQAYLSILVDRLLGMAGLVLVGALLFAANFPQVESQPQMRGIVLISVAMSVLLGLAVGLVVRFNRVVSPWLANWRLLHRFTTHMSLLVRYYRESLPQLGLCLLISVAIHVLTVTSLLVLALALFGNSLSISQLGLAGVMATLANQIPITPGGLALGESTFAFLCHRMDPVNVTTDYGSAVFLQRLVALIATLPGLFSYLSYRRAVSAEPNEVIAEKISGVR